MSPRKPSADDIALFRRSVGEVIPVRQDRIQAQQDKPAPRPKQRIADDAAVMRELKDGSSGAGAMETGDALLYRKPGIQDKVFRKLRRGQFAVSGELDLHGLTVNTARDRLAGFLGQCVKNNRRCVRIIHGKGLRSKQGRPTIKSLIGSWLQQRREVLAYCSARPVDGGGGAVYVLIKTSSSRG